MVIILKIVKPTLLVDEKKLRNNLVKMVTKAKNNNIRFRPHFKTHQSIEIGKWFRKYGINAITVSSVDMAYYFSEDGWNDITIAIPVNLLELDRIQDLAIKINLGVLVESLESVEYLIKKVDTPLNIWIEVDQGYHRTGISDSDMILRIARTLQENPHLCLKGLLTHAGHSYSTRSKDELIKIHIQSIKDLKVKQRALEKQGLKNLQLSIGDTPICSIATDFEGIDEIRPGNFIFYDLTQVSIGSCQEADIAIGVACPIIAKYPERDNLVIYGGAIHLSKDTLTLPSGERIYGKIASLSKFGWSTPFLEANVSSVSQEHGVIKMDASKMDQYQIGDILVIIPIHSCLTANLFNRYYLLDGTPINNIYS